MSSTQPTYYGYPQALDFGSIAYGDASQKQQVRVEYILSPTSTGAGVGLGANVAGQINVQNDVFYIDDQGSGAHNIVTISQDNATFFTKLNLSLFTAADPPFFINLFVNVAPVAGKTSVTGDFLVYLTSTQVPNFRLPIHFRIVNGLYVTPIDVRDSMAPIGYQKVTNFTIQDSFTNGSLPLWTKSSGYFRAEQTGTVVETDNSSPLNDAVSYTKFPDFGDYNVGAFLTLTSTGTAGIAFGIIDGNNYFRATISSVTGNAEIDQIVGGFATALTQASVGTVFNVQYRIRVEKHPGSVQFFVNEVPALQWAGAINTGPCGLTVTSSGGNVATAYFNEYQVSEDTFQFTDQQIQKVISEEQNFIEQRTRRIYGTQTVTELLDWNEQDVARMPFQLNRAFNTLGVTSSTNPDSSLTSPQLTSNYSKSMWLRYRPVSSVISVEEDISPDGSVPQWTLRTQGRNGDYLAYPDLGRIIFIQNYPRNGRQNLRVIYAVGTAGIPPAIQGYVKESVALRLLENIGVGNDAIAQIVQKKKERLVRYEEFIPQWTGQYAIGSGQKKT